MGAWRRLTLLAATVLFSSFAFAATAQAAGGPGGPGGGPVNPPAGSYHVTTLRASYNLFSPYPGPSININVARTNNESIPSVGPSSVTSETNVFISVSGPSGYVNACVVLATPTDFIVSSNLQTASLHTAISGSAPGCGFPNYVPTPFTLDVTWQAAGPIASSHGDSNFMCDSYRLKSITSSTGTNANATASLTPLIPGSFTVIGHAGLDSVDQRIDAAGMSPDACPPAIATKGAGGGGLQPAGSYTFTTLQAGSNFSDPSGSQIGIFVSNGTQISRLEDGPPTTTQDTNVQVQVSRAGTFGFACFKVASTDFTISEVLSAALHTNITTSNVTCGGPIFGSVPLPLNLDVMWTGSGPVATLRTEGEYRCGDYSSKSDNVILTNPAAVTASATPLLTGTLTGTFATLTSSIQHVEAEGLLQQACVTRV